MYIHLDLSEYECITDVSALDHVHTLRLDNCTGIADVSALGNVRYPSMSECSGITDVKHWVVCMT
jgi:hypothetical protein